MPAPATMGALSPPVAFGNLAAVALDVTSALVRRHPPEGIVLGPRHGRPLRAGRRRPLDLPQPGGGQEHLRVVARHGDTLVTLDTVDGVPEDVLLAAVDNVHVASPEELAPPW